MAAGTRVMLGGMTSHPIAFLIPIILTLVLLNKRKISFRNRHLKFTLLLLILWSVIQIVVKKQYGFKDFNNYIFIIYALIISYIHIQVYKEKLFPLFVDVMSKIAVLSLLIWFITALLPDLAMNIARLFPKLSHGYNVLYIIQWMDVNDVHVSYGVIRNAGSSWEPGRFAIMLSLAFLISLYSDGTSLIKNRKALLFVITILTTMSTTGYVMCIVLYIYMYMRSLKLNNVFKLLIIGVPFILFIMQLDFIGEKLSNKLEINRSVEHIEEAYQYIEANEDEEDIYVMDRFPSFVFEGMNFIHDPIIGYGAHMKDSYFVKNYTPSVGFSGGLMTLFARHGFLLALFLTITLFASSKRIACIFQSDKKYGILICFVISMISYPIIWFPLYSAFWFYAFFEQENIRLLNEKNCNTINGI